MNILNHEEVLAAAVPVDVPVRGIYFLLRDQEITYVGQSTNCKARIMQHVKEKEFDSYAIFECLPEADLDSIEAAHIANHLPRGNTRMPPGSGLISAGLLKRDFGIGRIQLRRWVKRGAVTPVYMGEGVFYRQSEIDAAQDEDAASVAP